VPEPRDLVTSRPRLLVRRLVVVDKWYADCPLDEDGRGWLNRTPSCPRGSGRRVWSPPGLREETDRSAHRDL